jgi:hypothetical protein
MSRADLDAQRALYEAWWKSFDSHEWQWIGGDAVRFNIWQAALAAQAPVQGGHDWSVIACGYESGFFTSDPTDLAGKITLHYASPAEAENAFDVLAENIDAALAAQTPVQTKTPITKEWCEKMAKAEIESDGNIQAGADVPWQWAPGPDEFKAWCSSYFGPDSDESYIAEAIFNLPTMAQKFKWRVAQAPVQGDAEDAARWRALRKQHEFNDDSASNGSYGKSYPERTLTVFGDDGQDGLEPIPCDPGALDAAIDAARKAAKP